MCKWGTDVVMPLEIPADVSHSGKAYIKNVGVDACLAPIIKALNDAGVKTRACCCGHGKTCGHIALVDGRVLLVYPDKRTSYAALEAQPLKVDESAITEALEVFRLGANQRRGMRAALRHFIGRQNTTYVACNGCGAEAGSGDDLEHGADCSTGDLSVEVRTRSCPCEHFPCEHTPAHRRSA